MASDKLGADFWERLFTTEEGVTVTQKLSDIEVGKTVNFYDGYFVDDWCGTKHKIISKKVSAVGDNYMSDAYSITVIGPSGSRAEAFVKVLPAIKTLRAMARASQMHDREIKVYREYLPALKSFMESSGLADQIHLKTPELLFCRLDENKIPEVTYSDPANDNPWAAMLEMNDSDNFETILVNENLVRSGHRMNDKRAGADLAHVRVALGALVQYHAAGIAYLRKHGRPAPQHPWIAEVTMMEVNPQYMFGKFMPGQIAFLRAMDEPKLAERLEALLPKINELLKYEVPGTMGPLETLIHGDFWNNNMMFLYDEDNVVKDIKLVDFQIVRYSHPCTDLTYYLLANTTGDFRRNHLRTVLKEYFAQLVDHLKKFGIDILEEGYTEDLFFEDWKARLIRGFLLSMMVIPAILSEKKTVQETFDLSDRVMDEFKPTDGDSEEVKASKKESLKEQTEAAFMNMQNEQAMISNVNLRTRLLDLYYEMAEQNVF